MTADVPWPGDLTGWTGDERARLDAVCRGETVVANMRRAGHPRLWAWAQRAGLAVRIDRRSRWGNPFVIGRHGDRSQVIDAYRERLHATPELVAAADRLAGKVLGCWCAPEPCHGDVLAEVAPNLGPVSEMSDRIRGSGNAPPLAVSEMSDRIRVPETKRRHTCAIPGCPRPRALGRAVCTRHAALGDSYRDAP